MSEQPQWLPRVRSFALGLVLFGLLARALVTHEPMPGFGFDPLVQAPPPVGMGPTASLMLDVLTLLGSSILLWSLWRMGQRISVFAIALGLIGSVGVLLHGLVWNGFHIENLRIGCSWVSAALGAIALWHAASDAGMRRTIAGLLLACVAVLCAQGVMQVLLEHPRTVAQFEADRGSFLAAQGWREGSAQAMAFERRLRQPDPLGWFGLTNVVQSLAIACGFGLAIVTASAWKAARKVEGREGLIALVGMLLATGGCVLLMVAGPLQGGSMAKGPLGALALTIALLCAGTWCARRKLPVAWIGLAAIGVPLLAVVARGFLGDALGELSLRFRWFYLIGAAGIIGEHGLVGVGPEGFKSAYLLTKPDLSPEQVTSPHSVLVDWLATLGIAGIAWCGLLVMAAIRVARGLMPRADLTQESTPPEAKASNHALALIGSVIAACLLWSLLFEEWPIAASIEGGTVVLLVSSAAKLVVLGLLWLLAAFGVQRFATDSGIRLGLVATALVLIAHSQIEMTMTATGSAGWVMALLAAASAGVGSQPRASKPTLFMAGMVLTPALLGAVLCMAALPGITGWEAVQRSASSDLSRVTRIEQDLREAFSMPLVDAAVVRLRQEELARIAGVDPTEPLDSLLNQARMATLERASSRLDAAARAGGEHLESLRALVRLRLSAAQLQVRLGGDPAHWEALALSAGEKAIDRWPDRTGSWNAFSLATRAKWERTGEMEWAFQTKDALLEGEALDPSGLDFPWSLFELAEAIGDRVEATEWAQRCLEINERLRLDSAVQLSEDRVRRARRAASGEAPPPLSRPETGG